MQLLFVSLILLCPSDFSSLYKERVHIQMEFHPEKEIPILKGIAQQSATCKVDIDHNKTAVLIPDLKCQIILYYLFSSLCGASYRMFNSKLCCTCKCPY